MKRLSAGEDFGKLARTKSIRLWVRARGGELGFGTRASYGILGDTLFNSPAGKPLGPFRVDPYVGIFKVVGRHDRRQKTFEEARQEILKERTTARKQEEFRQSVDNLRARSSLTMHEDVLANTALH